MLLKFTYLLSAITLLVLFGNAGVNYSFQPPEGYTGANGSNCTSCHGDFAVNSGGGSVTATGLPVGTYTAGTPYNFSLTITHGAANRRRWGFSIAARNNLGQNVGTFTSTNANAGPNGTELSHNNSAVVTGLQASYTYTNLRWTAPVTPGTAGSQITFYYVGNAANGTGNTDGDYIYTGSTQVALPIQLAAFTADVKGSIVNLKWQTASESNSSHFLLEKSSDNQRFISIATVPAAGNSSATLNYAYTDDKPAYYERNTFYRLVLVDKDGTKRTSNVIAVNIKATKTFVEKIFPNPVKAGGMMQVQLVTNREQPVILQMISMNGKVVKQVHLKAVKGTNVIDVQLGRYTLAGMYSLQVIMEEQTQQIPVLVQY